MDQQQIIDEQIATLPIELKQFLSTSTWLETTRGVASQHHLSSEQSQTLEDEVLLVLLGLDLKENFSRNIQENGKISSLDAFPIAEEINTQIFSKIADFLPTELGADEDGIKQLGQPTDLLSTPLNLSTGEREEKILTGVGTPNEKLAWEQRKQGVANTLPQAGEKKYGGVDPYREPLQ